jgi:anti-anti-sigma factor
MVDDRRAEAALQGELDLANSPLLRNELLALIDGGLDAITLDLSALTFLDSSGIAVLVVVRKHALDQETEFQVTTVQPHVQRVLESSGVAEMFDLEPTQEDHDFGVASSPQR